MSENRRKTGRRKAPKTAFKPGKSGNPGGRPKMPENVKTYLQLNRASMTIECIETLRKWARSKKGGLAIIAATNLLKKTLPDTIAVDLSAEIDVDVSKPFDLSKLTASELKEFKRLMEKMHEGKWDSTTPLTATEFEAVQVPSDAYVENVQREVEELKSAEQKSAPGWPKRIDDA